MRVVEAVQAAAGVRGAGRPRRPNHLYGERGGGAARAVQQDELFHHQGRPHPQGGVSACLVQEQQKGESLRRQGLFLFSPDSVSRQEMANQMVILFDSSLNKE
jgi:hypothetical protein